MKLTTLMTFIVTLSGLISVTATGQTNRSQFEQERLSDRCNQFTKNTNKGDLYIAALEFLRVAKEIDIAKNMIKASEKNKSQRNCWISKRSGKGNYDGNNFLGKTILLFNGVGPGESYRVSVSEKKCDSDEEFARNQEFWGNILKQQHESIRAFESHLQVMGARIKQDHDLLGLTVLYSYDMFNGTDSYKNFSTQITSQENPFDIQVGRDMIVERDGFCQMARASRGGVTPP